VRALLILPLLAALGACAGRGTASDPAVRAFIAQRTAAIEALDLDAIADTYAEDYLDVCTTKADATARWKASIDGATAAHVAGVSVSHVEYLPHLGLAYFRADWHVHLRSADRTRVLYRKEETRLRLADGRWREWGEQSCQER